MESKTLNLFWVVAMTEYGNEDRNKSPCSSPSVPVVSQSPRR